MKKLVILSAACGVGKSAVTDALHGSDLLQGFVCMGSDEMGLNWWDYAGTDHEFGYIQDGMDEALRRAGERNLLFTTCMSPVDFYAKMRLPENIGATYLIGMTCSADEVRARLLARPAERMCGSEAFIQSQIEYNGWFLQNAGKFALHIDNTGETVEQTAARIAAFVNGLKEEENA